MARWRYHIAGMYQQREKRPYRKVTARSLSPTLTDEEKSGARDKIRFFGIDSHML